MKFKKIFTGLLSLAAALFAVCAISVCAGAETSGDYGYVVLDDGTVEITGYDGSATDLTIPSTLDGKSVTRIRIYAFWYCESLTSITIPDSVTSIDDSAFYGCSSLTSINVDDNNEYYSSQDGVLFNKDMTELLICPGGKAGEYVIPDGVTSIGDAAFRNCSSLTSVNIPDGAMSICDDAFSGCSSLTSIDISDGVIIIGDGAFSDCSSLASIHIPESVTSIGDSAFSDCSSLTSINIPDSVTSINDHVFLDCSSLASIDIPDGVTSIGYEAFYGCSSLTSINVGDNNEYYSSQDGVLFNKDMTELLTCPGGKAGVYMIPDGVTSIRDYAFIECSKLTSISIPDGVTSIVTMTFAGCSSLTSITIPESVTSIGYYAFINCSSLTSITIPESVTSIEASVFYNCQKLKDVYYTGSKAQWDKVTIVGNNDELLSATIHFGKVTAPSSVSGLKLKARAADALRLTWDENANADGYIIEMKDGSKWTRVGKITNNSTVEFKKSKLKAGTAYTFRVKAYKMDGKAALYSGYTTISARTNPSVTSGLKLKARAADALRLTWTKNTSADGYIIEMKSGNSWVRVGKITNNSTVEFKKSKLKAGTAYTFRVKAYKMSGKTALYSTVKTISVRTNPSATTGLKLKNSAKNAVRLSWTKNTSADGYIIEMKVGGVWKRAGKITSNSTVEFKKSGLKGKTSYSFRIKAYKMSGKTALYGATKTITVKTK